MLRETRHSEGEFEDLVAAGAPGFVGGGGTAGGGGGVFGSGGTSSSSSAQRGELTATPTPRRRPSPLSPPWGSPASSRRGWSWLPKWLVCFNSSLVL